MNPWRNVWAEPLKNGGLKTYSPFWDGNFSGGYVKLRGGRGVSPSCKGPYIEPLTVSIFSDTSNIFLTSETDDLAADCNNDNNDKILQIQV